MVHASRKTAPTLHGVGQKPAGIRKVLRARLGDHRANTVQVVEIAIMDVGARTLFEGTVRPGCRTEPGATRAHALTTRSLAGSPPFLEVYPDLLETLWARRVIVYNASYDRRFWDAAVRSLGARGSLAGEPPLWACDMRRCATYVGEPQSRGAATATRSSARREQRRSE